MLKLRVKMFYEVALQVVVCSSNSRRNPRRSEVDLIRKQINLRKGV